MLFSTAIAALYVESRPMGLLVGLAQDGAPFRVLTAVVACRGEELDNFGSGPRRAPFGKA